MIQRKIAFKLTQMIRQYPVISVTGPRQSGKTTLIQNLFSKFKYTNLEYPDVREFALNDPRDFLQQADCMIIDEIQHAPNLLSYIQAYVDEFKNKRFIISGSQNLLLSEKVSQSLAGRVFIANLYPLSFSELKKAHMSEKTLLFQLLKGFYPKIYHKRLEPSIWYNNYIQTYLERDVRNIKSVENLQTFARFLGLLAGRTAQLLNLSSLANDAGISVPTVKSWLSILEASYIIKLLMPYHTNWRKRLVKSPKIHFMDTGVICSLLHIKTADQLFSHPSVGAIFESFVFSEIEKSRANFETDTDVFFWRDKTGREIDFLLESSERVEAIEAKYGKTVNQKFFTVLKWYQVLSKTPIKGTVVYGGEHTRKQSGYLIKSWRDL